MVKFPWDRLLSRRRTLRLGIGSVATVLTVVLGRSKYSSSLLHALGNNQRNLRFERNQRSFPIVGNASLKVRAKAKGLIYGAFPQADAQDLAQDTKFRSSFIQECGLLVSGFYWSHTRPSVNTFDFTSTDYFAQFASANKLLLRGHPLLWHEALPDWFQGTLNRENAENILINHIQTIVQRYAGKIHSWDVVNEAIKVSDGRSDNLRKTPWLEVLGPDYLELAFRTASQADPNALLVYNDNGMDYDTREADAKRNAVLKLLEGLISKGTPIHALGIQAHLSGNETRFNPQKLQNFLTEVANLGLKIMITEMDVSDNKLPIDIQVRDRIIAAAYEDYLSVVLDEKAVIAVLTWGLSDRYTWLSYFRPRPDQAPVRPLPLSEQMERKLAWNAIAHAFRNAPRR